MAPTTRSTADSQPMLYLPETMANWPWKRAINPYYEEVSHESNEWFHSFNALNPRSRHAFERCDFGRYASLGYPSASREHLRTGCDLINLGFLIHDYTDAEPTTEAVRNIVEVVIDAVENPEKPRPGNEVILGEIARQFWLRGRETATPSAARHMIDSFTAYLRSIVVRTEDREKNHCLSVDDYLVSRRENIGARSLYVPLELAFDFPDEVFYHPVIVEMGYVIADLMILDNDIVSYNKEQAIGDDSHNILTIVMRQFNLDLEAAMDWVVKYHHECEARFLGLLKVVPSWGPEIDRDMADYIYGLANWPRCNDCWNFESGRYFGDKGLEIQKTRRVPLMPKTIRDSTLRRENVVVPLVEL